MQIDSLHHVSATHRAKEERQDAQLLERRREQASRWRPGGAAACAVSRRDQLLAGGRVAQGDRGVRRGCRPCADAVAVPGGSMRGDRRRLAVQLRLSEMRLRRPRQWGACWLAGQLWQELQLDRFWADRLPPSRKNTRWDQILQVLVSYRLIAPGSEWRLHREWFGNSAMADLLGADFGLAEAHKLYACHDLLLAAQGGAVLASGRALARSVQRRVRRAAVRSDQHLLRGQRVRPAGRRPSAATATAATSGRTARRW